jgi:TPR repeat protein
MYEQGIGLSQDLSEAARWYRKSADQGNELAQLNLGVAYDNGLGVQQDFAEAANLYRLSALQGNADAQMNLGDMYRYGRGVKKDGLEAAKWYHAAIDNGLLSALIKLADLYLEGGLRFKSDPAQGVQLLKDAAEKGSVDAEFELAERYENGQGVEKDKDEAINWYKRAALHGDRAADAALWEKVEGSEMAEIVISYRRLAEAGKAFAQETLGRAYGLGLGVKQNDAEAARWYKLAAEQGAVTAQVVLARMYEVGQGVPLDVTEAVRWYESAAAQGSSEAQTSLGDMYFYGRGVTRDDAEAMLWYKRALETFNIERTRTDVNAHED